MTTWTRDVLWRVVNGDRAVALVRTHGHLPAGTRGTVLRFGTRYARVAFDGEQWPIDVALWMITLAPMELVTRRAS